MKEAMEALLPRLVVGRRVDFKVIDHGSKRTLLNNLPARMKGYAKWPDARLRILVLVDRDDDDCVKLKNMLEAAATDAGLPTKTAPDQANRFKVVNRIVIEELEAWFLGDNPALVKAFPRVPTTLGKRARFRDPDAVSGGTWEALREVLNKAGYYAGSGRLPKIEVARSIAPLMEGDRNRSRRFRAFLTGLDALLAVCES